MLSKTLEEWLAETQKYASFYYERYASSFEDKSCPESTRDYYCKVAKSHWNLKDLLAHIKNYGGIYTAHNCLACKTDPSHSRALLETYARYEKWIKNTPVSKRN
jgi:hypothetical protein